MVHLEVSFLDPRCLFTRKLGWTEYMRCCVRHNLTSCYVQQQVSMYNQRLEVSALLAWQDLFDRGEHTIVLVMNQ